MTAYFTAEDVGIEVIRAAQQWLDLWEVAPNAEWSGARNSAFKAFLKKGGHQPGWAYCMTFAKACYLDGYGVVGAPPATLRLISEKFTPSVVRTWANVKTLVRQDQPLPGSLMLQRLGQSAQGHAGIVVISGPESFVTIEANTSPGVAKALGLEREGDGIYLKPPKPIDFTPSQKLWTMGFLPVYGSQELEFLSKEMRKA